jgi:hypothetical protein
MALITRRLLLVLREDGGIVYTLGNKGAMCVRQFGPYPPQAEET